MSFKSLAVWLTVAVSTTAIPIDERQTASCSSYTIINTRGTGERQGPSSGFTTINSNIMAQFPGGKIYNTVYPASFNQDSSAGTADIVREIQSVLSTSPSECFVLEGYSQGAAATVNALPKLTDAATFAAIKAVFLIGDPLHKAGLACNLDNNGGTTTRNVNGISARFAAGIPAAWVAKTEDVCILGDGVCDTTNGRGITAQHLQYSRDAPTQSLGTKFIAASLSG